MVNDFMISWHIMVKAATIFTPCRIYLEANLVFYLLQLHYGLRSQQSRYNILVCACIGLLYFSLHAVLNPHFI